MCRKFADGFPNVFVKDATRIRNRHVAFLASFQDPASIFEQLSVIYQLPRMFVGSFTLVLPYFPTGTAERVCTLLKKCPSPCSTSDFGCKLISADFLIKSPCPGQCPRSAHRRSRTSGRCDQGY